MFHIFTKVVVHCSRANQFAAFAATCWVSVPYCRQKENFWHDTTVAAQLGTVLKPSFDPSFQSSVDCCYIIQKRVCSLSYFEVLYLLARCS